MKAIYAEVLTIGDEILYGQIADTNAQFISAELDKIGIKVVRLSSVGDEEDVILRALEEAKDRADLVLMTGGLGPTKDDITKKTLATFFKTEMVENAQVLQMIEDYFKSLGQEMGAIIRAQAQLPANAEPVFNRLGSAPAMWFHEYDTVFVSMPGVPVEMKVLMEEEIIPKIQQHFDTPVIYHKLVRTFGKGESDIAKRIHDWAEALPEHIKLAYLPSWGQVKLRLTATGSEQASLEAEVAEQIELLKPLLPREIFGYDKEELEEVVGNLLFEQGKTVSTAESCTGGYIAHLFTKVAGSSRYFVGGIAAYSNEVKRNRLGVKAETLEEHGAVSEETVRQMAENVREKFQTDIGVASSGVAGPGGGSPEKPVGTVWVAYADGERTYARKLQLTRDRKINITLTSYIVLDMIRRFLSGLMRDK